ncbi:putative mitochondrial protein fmp26 protein [Neofusicoccum parvum UCRNP2]|uniref:Altered inheritance of mitochondria protein 24, mitochondrial n=1 Tax=Botryosphaeria parva (strain UCR-NP2) TaxID=1287680 RepID=R1EPS8_BOTPV|nr:putative mitochondrial protein fmp26 protein [Neofusicoccum parvum UCRNP2]
MRALPTSSSWGSRAVCRACRARVAPPLVRRQPIHISEAPSSSTPSFDQDVSAAASSTPDARFEVLGSPYSLLSVSLSASQNLYTRRGTLVAVNGKVENAVSSLSILEPFRRAPLGVPFLYQKLSSASPITALISSKSPVTSFAVVHLDGRLDWLVAQRQALLAWTGHALSVKPRVNTKMSLAHWGNSHVTGRGLLALVGKGQIYQVHLKAGEEYVVHPSNILAYTMTANPPLPYRFKSTSLRFQVPSLTGLFPNTKFFEEMRKTQAFKTLAQFLFTLRTWTRRTIWGDRLFLQFRGPSTILIQSRAGRLTDSLTTRDVNEIADTPAGAVQEAVNLDLRKESGHGSATTPAAEAEAPKEKVTYAQVGSDGKIKFGEQ